jgi:phospholipase/lecithinase/hemolysin
MIAQKTLSQMRHALLVSSLPIALVVSTPAIAQTYTGLYVFGDSLSDTGNVYRVTGNLFPPSPPYFDGRLADGPLWVEFLAQQLGLPFDPLRNFAFVSATSGATNTAPIPGLPGLQQEFQLFRATNPVVDSGALYTVLVGNNDYLGGGETNPAIPVNNVVGFVRSLADLGARNILVSNLPDLGRIPLVNQDPILSGGLTTLTTTHNLLLGQQLDLLRQERPELTLISLDLASLLNQAVQSPSTFGFTNVTDACLPFSPGLQLVPDGPPCSNPTTFLFWDRIHVTSAAHQQIASTAFQAIEVAAIPEPTTTLGIFTFAAFLAGAKAKGKRRKGVRD